MRAIGQYSFTQQRMRVQLLATCSIALAAMVLILGSLMIVIAAPQAKQAAITRAKPKG